jgi:hypothetical protein
MAYSTLAYNIRKQICKQAGFPTGTLPCSACSFILRTEKAHFAGGENIVFAHKITMEGRYVCESNANLLNGPHTS